MMKKIVLVAVFCAAVLSPVRACSGWSYKYWYCPVSWSEAKVYFQLYWAQILCVGGEGPLPDSNENNTTELPFQYALGHLSPSCLPWGVNVNGMLIDYALNWGYLGHDMTIVTVDEGITHIGNWWFQCLMMLVEVSMPLSLQSVGEGAFKDCIRLPHFYCFDNVKTIGSRAFEGCGNLSEFTRYENASDDGHYYNISEAPLNIGNRAFADCGSLKNFKIPANSTLGNEVFRNSGLESVDLGNNVKFGSNAFQDCKNFKQFTVPANYTLGDSIFSNSSLETVTVNDNVTFGKYTFQNCKKLNSITFLGRINAVTEGMFHACTGLPSVNIPNGVTSIGNNAFAYCYGLRTVNIPNSVTSIGDSAFNESGLTSVIIPNSVTKIGIRAFKYSSLTSITVSGSVKDIEHATFAYSYLISVKLCEGVKTVYTSAFQSCGNLEEVSLPASLDSVGRIAFGRCNNIKIIECNGTTPPALDPDAFLESDITETSLCVPYGSVEAYMNAPVWKDFKNIGTYPAGIHIINGEKFTVNSGSKIKLTAKLTPYNAVPAIVWTSSNTGIASVVDGTVIAHDPGEVIITSTTVNGIFRDSCRIQVLEGFRIPVFADSLLGEWLQCDENFQGIFNPETMKIRELIDISPEGNRTASYTVRLYDFSQLRESYYCTVDEKNRSVYMQFLHGSVFFTAVELTDNTMTVTRDGSLCYYKRKG